MSDRGRIVLGDAPRAISEAAALLERGELVAFPTETVYGLGADARSAEAVAKIFAAKGRPPNNPIIVHVSGAAEAQEVVEGWDRRADALAAALWPGPLTLVLKRRPDVPAIVSAGGATLAVRAPVHPIARKLLSTFGGPIAAPSANRSNAVSPTRAEHVQRELGESVSLILDGGPCEVGLESTVLDLTVTPPRILRPGAVLPSTLAEILEEPVDSGSSIEGPLRSPGQLPRHYAPHRPLHVVSKAEIEALDMKGFHSAAILTCGPWEPPPPAAVVRVLPADPQGYGRELYEALRWADEQPVERIWIEAPPGGEAWSAVQDRLNRAATSAE